MILFTAGEAIYHSALKLIEPEPIRNLGWVAVAAIIGFLGNELVAVYRIRTGTGDRLGCPGRRRLPCPHRRVYFPGGPGRDNWDLARLPVA
jgi:hypothetical protein